MDETTRLLLAARDGDRASLRRWVRRTQPEVWRLCASLVDPAAADDLTQEVYLRAHGALADFRGEGSSRTWLLTIARRTCADEIRRRVRDRRLEDPRAPLPGDAPSPGQTGLVDLADLLGRLPDHQREALVLTQVVGLAYAEAAEVCGCAVGTIRSRVARARQALVERLPETGWRAAEG